MSDLNFPTKYAEILEIIESINPVQYASTRNYLNGSVTRLSPYLTHGVISLIQIADAVLEKHGYEKSEKLLSELAWREYYLRVWENKADNIFENLATNNSQSYWENIQFKQGIPSVLNSAETGIKAIDDQILLLKNTGYMHNHARMWLSGTVTNIAHYNWKDSAKWLYYYLLDGDLASNTLSWQWVAGTSRNKTYFANQENINKYAETIQLNTFLDKTYEELEVAKTPENFLKSEELDLKTNLNLFGGISVAELNISSKDVLLYHPWMLNPDWNFGAELNKILLIEPSAFNKNPISDQRIQFILDLASQIENLQIVIAEVEELPKDKNYLSVSSPAIRHWRLAGLDVIFDEQHYLFPEVSQFFPSFFAYWNNCLKNSIWLKGYTK